LKYLTDDTKARLFIAILVIFAICLALLVHPNTDDDPPPPPPIPTSVELQANWQFEADPPQIDGFRIYNAAHEIVKDEIPNNVLKTTFEVPNICGVYYIVSYKGELESSPSYLSPWCPDTIKKTSFYVIPIPVPRE
jgi:hypothetical protein